MGRTTLADKSKWIGPINSKTRGRRAREDAAIRVEADVYDLSWGCRADILPPQIH
jgi:hypothetical protein